MKHSRPYLDLFIFLISFSFHACSQGDSAETLTPAIKYRQHTVGSATFTVKETRYANAIPLQFIQLHSNEETADEVTTLLSREMGINYVQILNDNRRFLEFELANRRYRFDPNRIFSDEGIEATLRSRSQYSEKAAEAIASFTDFLLSMIDRKKTIIAVHNNTEGAFTLTNYIRDKSGLVFQNPAQDPDDFFITTDSTLFERIKEKNFSVVLEFKDAVKQDGSLSIYCGKNNIPYVNVEAQHGHRKEQEMMLRALIDILK